MMNGRRVQTYRNEYIDGRATRKVEDRVGFFHQFGVDFEEFESGPGMYTTAIIEYDDGSIESLPVSLIRFIDKHPINRIKEWVKNNPSVGE